MDLGIDCSMGNIACITKFCNLRSISVMFIVVVESHQSPITLYQQNVSYLNESTTLVCKVDSHFLTQFDWFRLSWMFYDDWSQENASLASVQWSRSWIGKVVAYVHAPYKWKVNASWDESKKESNLTILNTTLDDDKDNREWYCQLSSYKVSHRIEVRGE